jgi:hypothetical protein
MPHHRGTVFSSMQWLTTSIPPCSLSELKLAFEKINDKKHKITGKSIVKFLQEKLNKRNVKVSFILCAHLADKHVSSVKQTLQFGASLRGNKMDPKVNKITGEELVAVKTVAVLGNWCRTSKKELSALPRRASKNDLTPRNLNRGFETPQKMDHTEEGDSRSERIKVLEKENEALQKENEEVKEEFGRVTEVMKVLEKENEALQKDKEELQKENEEVKEEFGRVTEVMMNTFISQLTEVLRMIKIGCTT